LPRYQDMIKNLKEEEYYIAGYARKSVGEKNDQARVRLLNKVCQSLKERSLVNKVFVSVSYKADDELLTQDNKRNEDLLAKINAEGDMQDKKKNPPL
ncbi:hypothetical protein BCV72DRAFT_198897, partial [Rhizopus microsporus var. microsporus]